MRIEFTTTTLSVGPLMSIDPPSVEPKPGDPTPPGEPTQPRPTDDRTPAPLSSPSADLAPATAADDAPPPTPQLPPVGRPWITVLTIAICVGVFFGLNSQPDPESWEAMSKFGVLPAGEIWDGGYWALVCSAFAHVQLWHVGLNLYWLWIFGAPLERAIGSIRFLAFFLVAAAVSSAYQLAFSDSTGIGASGVLYAMFGFLWWGRNASPEFAKALSGQTSQYLFIWLFVCLIATWTGQWQIGNAAHFSGLLFGIAVAAAFVVPGAARTGKVAVAGLAAAAIVPLFWAPWSVSWLGYHAYKAHAAERYDEAYELYSQVIERAPESAWAHLNRSYVNEALGEPERARVDRQIALSLDPTIEQQP